MNPLGRPALATRALLVSVWICGLVVIAGCAGVRPGGSAIAQDSQGERSYKAIYAEHMTRVRSDNLLFAPTSSSPGVCNKGGSQQGCFDADAVLIQDLQAMQRALDAIPVPARYSEANKFLRDALAQDIRGLELRNQAIAQHDDAAWTEHKAVLDKALASFQQAYQAFPPDNRPEPAP